MAITNAQQFKQLVNPPMDGKRPGYRGDAAAKAAEEREKETGQKSSRAPTTSRSDPGDNFDRESFQRARERGEANKTLEILKKDKEEEKIERFRNKRFQPPKFGGGISLFSNLISPFFQKGMTVNRNYFLDKVLPAGRIGMTPEEFANLSLSEQEAAYKDYMSARLSGETDAMGNPLPKGDEDKNPFIPLTTTSPIDVDANTEDALAGTGMAFRFMNRGGMPMDAPTTGGIMDLETGRQMYFLGKLVKKATRAVKKIVKSPLGKAAVLGGLAYFGGGGGNPFTAAGRDKFSLANLFSLTKNPLISKGGEFSPMRAIGLASLSPFLFSPEQEEEDDEQTFDRGRKLDIANIRANPYTFIPRRFAAEGGSMKEPVAKKTMPLIDMDGKEKDYRETGGFVDIGRMERADDVPARLSKNEFVFTADAVRNAGDGSVDKGAEVMYNMMKNLESGGEVSEESQGLEGARKMFQTSQRLEEVL